jgi:hypothetical protein
LAGSARLPDVVIDVDQLMAEGAAASSDEDDSDDEGHGPTRRSSRASSKSFIGFGNDDDTPPKAREPARPSVDTPSAILGAATASDPICLD